jgi:AAA+ superfamily predicted ATPase
MNNIEQQWQDANNAYLGKALEWLRLRLQQRAEQYSAVSQATIRQDQEKKSSWFSCKTKTEKNASPARTDADDLARLEKELIKAESATHPPALTLLSQRLGLSRFEQRLLLLCAAMELDPDMAEFCCRAQNDPQRAYPTFALAFTLFADPDWSALAATSPLRYWRLLDIHQPGPRPLTVSALHLDERILNYLKGLNYLDDRLAAYIAPLDRTDTRHGNLPASQQTVVDAILHHAQQTSNGQSQNIQLLGTDRISKQDIAYATAKTLGRQLFRMPAELLPAQSAELESLVQLWQRESYLLPLALYLECGEDREGTAAQAMQRFVSRFNGWIFVDTRELRPGLGAAGMAFDVQKPTTVEQMSAWLTESPAINQGDARRLANQFNLNLSAIRDIAHSAQPESSDDGRGLLARLWQGCLLHTRPQLDKLAQRIESKADWNDLVLPDETKLLLKQIAEQVPNRHKVYDDWGFRQKMSRGLGISVLFAGASGTGKTMAAEVLAKELELNLYRIDLSAVISKYIGETEKNLRKVFDAAEDGGTLLFFDEADALFGKRSEVKDSHDRFANTQVADLLQRMEAYSGLAILATNMKSALDQAFLRRLRFIVNFTFPGAAERKLIWQKAFTGKVFKPETRQGDLDFDRLSQFNLTGGNIHSIALNAAFLAAQNNEYVTMCHVIQAVRTEFRKLDKPINEAEFRMMEIVRSNV